MAAESQKVPKTVGTAESDELVAAGRVLRDRVGALKTNEVWDACGATFRLMKGRETAPRPGLSG